MIKQQQSASATATKVQVSKESGHEFPQLSWPRFDRSIGLSQGYIIRSSEILGPGEVVAVDRRTEESPEKSATREYSAHSTNMSATTASFPKET